MNNNELKEQINAVVEAREKAVEAKAHRIEAYEEWAKEHEGLFLVEKEYGAGCAFEESKLREMTLQAYADTGNKAPEVGVGIRLRTVLSYESQGAMSWALEHKLALKLDTSAFEKIAKTSDLPFVTIAEEPQATIATELKEAIIE